MTEYAGELVGRLTAAFEAARDPQQAPRMAAYMRNQFPFFGVSSPKRRLIMREALQGLPVPQQRDVEAAVRDLWALPEREYQYCACELFARQVRRCDASLVATLEAVITAKSWWDTVDAMAANVVGPLVRAFPEFVPTMDTWARGENTWLQRTAILHQLGFRSATDASRLFEYCTIGATHTDFFIRKAIGWALRQYSKTDEAAVRAYVAAHPELSPLSIREALLWLNGGRNAKARSGL